MIKITNKPFYFIRHGQTDWNAEHKVMGSTDIPLNAKGEKQTKAAIGQVLDLKIASICYSPLKRAARTAEILNEAIQCDMHPIEELKEFNLGENAGKVLGDWFDDWMKGTLIPGGESFHQFQERALLGVNKALTHKSPVLIVAHGGIYWAIQRAVRLPDLPDLPNSTLALFMPPYTNNYWKCAHYQQNQLRILDSNDA